MKPLLVMSAPVATRSGYGDHSRDLLRSLIAMDKYDIKVLSQRWGSCPMNALGEEDKDIASLLHFGNLPKQPDIWIQVTVPNEFQPVGKYNIGITAGIETTHVSHPWVEGMNRMNLVIVTSEHSKQSFVNSVYDKINNHTKQKEGEFRVNTPMEVLFEGVDTKIWKKTNEITKTVADELSSIKESFCFLFVGHWLHGNFGHDRKDVGGMLKTFFETFKRVQNKPALILKTSQATFSVIDRENILKRIREIAQQCGENLPNVYLLHGDLEPEEMNSLYNHPKVKAMISFTHGEGYGRPLAEFCVTQKPVIASNWSGHIDFLKHSVLLPGELQEVHPSAQWENVVIDKSQWFYVNHLYASRVLKDVHKKYKKYIPDARKQARLIREDMNLDKMTDKFREIMDKYVKVPEQVALNMPKIKLPKLEKIS
tara:strand:+ start:1870 stop:3144 length:1275 start_codon:yes stop_codon:yes gene_type:complete